MMKPITLIIFIAFFLPPYISYGKTDFFAIKSIKFIDKQPKRGFALYQEEPLEEKNPQRIFLPFLEVKLQTSEEIRANSLYVKAYC